MPLAQNVVFWILQLSDNRYTYLNRYRYQKLDNADSNKISHLDMVFVYIYRLCQRDKGREGKGMLFRLFYRIFFL